MIPDDLRLALVDKLLCVPSVAGGGQAGRDALLSGMPNLFLYRNDAGSARGDVMLLVAQLSEIFGANGEWRLLQLVDNALPLVQGTEAGTELLKIREELLEAQKGLRPVLVHPSEVAQVHLFDLRQPVYICIGKLLDVVKASGFVITTPIPRLLGYFCDSLKQRGAREGLWGRDEVAATGPPAVIDPIHTTVAVAASKSDKVRSLLVRKHVLWPIYVDDAADAAALWQQLEGAFEDTLGHHLVIAFGMPADANAPPGMIRLAPKFTSKDISNWVTAIGEKFTWREKEIGWWAKLILMNCLGNPDDLPAEMVYEQLERHCALVVQNRNPDDLMNALKDLETWSFGG